MCSETEDGNGNFGVARSKGCEVKGLRDFIMLILLKSDQMRW